MNFKLLGAVSLFTLALGSVSMASPRQAVSVVRKAYDVGDIYKKEVDEDNYVVLELLDEGKCKLTVFFEGEGKTKVYDYVLEENILKVVDEEEHTNIAITLDPNTFEILDVKIEEIEAPCKVVISKLENGKVETEVESGYVGDIVKLDIRPDAFYLLESVEVNGTTLIENEDGEYAFALVEGENIIKAHFVVNEKLLGELSVIYEEIKAKDWTALFSWENLVRVCLIIFDSGILFVIIRYFYN